MGKTMTIKQADITTLDVDAIVNAANRSLLGGGGVDGAIHKAAGPELLEATKKLNGAKTGEAKMTEGFNLPADYVIHAVGPMYRDGQENEAELLASCYENALKLADEQQLTSIAFSAISTGVYGYPADEATKIAVKTVQDLLGEMKTVEEVIFVVFDEELKEIYETTFEQLDINHS